MFDHVTIRSERGASERFDETVLRTLGNEKTYSDERYTEWDDFSLAAATDEKPSPSPAHLSNRRNIQT